MVQARRLGRDPPMLGLPERSGGGRGGDTPGRVPKRGEIVLFGVGFGVMGSPQTCPGLPLTTSTPPFTAAF